MWSCEQRLLYILSAIYFFSENKFDFLLEILFYFEFHIFMNFSVTSDKYLRKISNFLEKRKNKFRLFVWKLSWKRFQCHSYICDQRALIIFFETAEVSEWNQGSVQTQRSKSYFYILFSFSCYWNVLCNFFLWKYFLNAMR